MIKDSGDRTVFETGGQRDMQKGKGRFDLIPLIALFRLAKHLEEGAIKYDDRNWELGIPISNYCDSAIRHILKYMCGLRDEPHLSAALWNIACAIETLVRIKSEILPKNLDDLPYTYSELDYAKFEKLLNEVF